MNNTLAHDGQLPPLASIDELMDGVLPLDAIDILEKSKRDVEADIVKRENATRCFDGSGRRAGWILAHAIEYVRRAG